MKTNIVRNIFVGHVANGVLEGSFKQVKKGYIQTKPIRKQIKKQQVDLVSIPQPKQSCISSISDLQVGYWRGRVLL